LLLFTVHTSRFTVFIVPSTVYNLPDNVQDIVDRFYVQDIVDKRSLTIE
jgi:hypothetical protein